MPGQPEPVYPPGQFSAWNRPSVRAAWLGISQVGDAHGEPEAEPGYSLLAVSDPSADSTATQTLAVIDEDPLSRDWPPSRVSRDWRSHAEDAVPVAERRPVGAAGPRAAGPRAGDAATGGSVTGRRGTRGAKEGPGQRVTGEHDSQRDSGTPGSQRAVIEAGKQSPASRHAQARSEPPTAAAVAEAAGGRRRAEAGSAARTVPGRRGRTHKRSNMMMAALLLSPVLVVVLVVVGYVYVTGKHASSGTHPLAAPPSHPVATPSASPTPTLGPWKHIANRTLDTLPLSMKELFPAHFTAGLVGARTIDRAGDKCTHAVIGSALQTAVHKAHCTQVLRASYLSGDRKLMATIGVLNLLNVKAAERAGRASGRHQFIKQLAAKHGPTRRLSKGTGLEEADVLGHYLILTWTEFSNLHKPSGKKQLAELKKFSADLITGTANISLTSRMVTGAPRTP